MRKRLLLVGVILVVGLAAALAFYAFSTRTPDFTTLGGTLLVFDLQPTTGAALTDTLAAEAAKVLQVRLERAVPGVLVSANSNRQVEVRVPKTDRHDEQLNRLAVLLTPIGDFEFRILANSRDDSEAIRDVKRLINDELPAEKLVEMQEQGLPPPLPLADEKAPRIYEVRLAGAESSVVSYRWTELGPSELRMCGLDSAAATDPERRDTFLAAEKGRNKAQTIAMKDGRLLLGGALVYSRECKAKHLSEKERTAKGVEFFVLTRDAEIDLNKPENLPVQERRTPRFDSRYITSAVARSQRIDGPRPAGSPDRYWVVEFSLDSKGAELLRTLTRKNRPTVVRPDELKELRVLAMVLDGLIMTAPSINSEITGGRGQLAGQFNENEVRNLADILRSGPLPCRIKQPAVSTTSVPGK